MARKQYAIIGIGRFGSSIARTLSEMGFDVLAIDSDEHRVQEVSHIVTQAVVADSTDEEALRAIGLRNFDVVVVAIGEDIQSSILTTLILKEMEIPTVLVKAQNDLHAKVVQRIGADKVIFPERDMGVRVAHHLTSPNVLDYIELSDDYSIVEMKASDSMIGRNLIELNIRARYRCNVMAIKRDNHMNIAPAPEEQLQANDIVVIVGQKHDLIKLEMDMED
ncbi:potassium channel family protein [Paenibacillus hunanensis]|uniref:Trk system potassium uptake protein TrkA n=1 Tax=Paenibacillus hunanensis TaxID=539262 RepID=A0ABU1J695_9BACL|nr:TrkA family potassium uptake protein [Paenibacillus hunanensis]MDR6246755.1 trk system potassium uptake protein TrkA [Paenibacillus hunanensis]WPP40720.1 TrkA family potassium uptake protein [Paenibacillus hunanensis]GGJ33027.1 potassium transporter Trk [Paenibacillus hunanensis]